MTASREDSRRTRIRLLLAIALGVVSGLVLRGCAQPGQTSERRAAEFDSGKKGEPGPREIRVGVPVGFAHSADGARSAAATYVTTGQLMLDLAPTEAADAVREMAARASADEQVRDLLGQLSDLRDRLANGTGPARYLQSVLATRVVAFGPSRARVAVWSVGVLSRRDVAPPQAGWTTSTFDLVWERSDWKVWAEDVKKGPTPMLNEGASPATDDEFDTALRGFESWRVSS